MAIPWAGNTPTLYKQLPTGVIAVKGNLAVEN